MSHAGCNSRRQWHGAAALFVLAACTVCVLFAVTGRGGNGVVIFGPTEEVKPAEEVKASLSAVPVTGGYGAMPAGCVVAWLKSFTNTPPLPVEWVECNGQQLDMQGSPYDGQVLPDLNGADNQDKRFLRGSTRSGAAGGAETHNHGFYLINRSEKRVINIAGKNEASNLPPYYEVVWIMKVL